MRAARAVEPENHPVSGVPLMLVRVGGRWFAFPRTGPAGGGQAGRHAGAHGRTPCAGRDQLARRLGAGHEPGTDDRCGRAGGARFATTLPRLVVLRAGECEIALVVDEIRGIVDDFPRRSPGVKAGGAGRPGFLREEFDWQDTRVCVLDVPQLVAAAAGRSQGGA
jgi:hypothetical protein